MVFLKTLETFLEAFPITKSLSCILVTKVEFLFFRYMMIFKILPEGFLALREREREMIACDS